MHVIAGAAGHARGDVGAEVAVFWLFRFRIESGEAFGLLRPANVGSGEVAGAEVIGHFLRIELGADGDEEVSEAAGRGERRGIAVEGVILHEAHEEAPVAPQQGQVVIARILGVEGLSEISFRMLQGKGCLHEVVKYGEAVAERSGAGRERPDPAAGNIAAEICEPSSGFSAQVLKYEFLGVGGMISVEDTVAREPIAIEVGSAGS